MPYTIGHLMLISPSDNLVLVIGIALLVLIISIILHEVMHGLIGLKLGDTTAKDAGRLTLNPVSHIDPFATVLLPIVLIVIGAPPFGAAKPVPLNPSRLRFGDYGMAIVAVAGPLTNLLLAAIGGVMLRLTGTLENDLWVTWWWYFTIINTGFFIFNMIPFPPLDGSRLLYAFAPEALQKVMLQIEMFGIMAIVVFMFLIFPIISPILRDLNQQLVSLLLGVPL